jgi:hypothetical protein
VISTFQEEKEPTTTIIDEGVKLEKEYERESCFAER